MGWLSYCAILKCGINLLISLTKRSACQQDVVRFVVKSLITLLNCTPVVAALGAAAIIHWINLIMACQL